MKTKARIHFQYSFSSSEHDYRWYSRNAWIVLVTSVWKRHISLFLQQKSNNKVNTCYSYIKLQISLDSRGTHHPLSKWTLHFNNNRTPDDLTTRLWVQLGAEQYWIFDIGIAAIWNENDEEENIQLDQDDFEAPAIREFHIIFILSVIIGKRSWSSSSTKVLVARPIHLLLQFPCIFLVLFHTIGCQQTGTKFMKMNSRFVHFSIIINCKL